MLSPLINFAQTYNYTYDTSDPKTAVSNAAAAGTVLLFWLIYMVVFVIMIVSIWRLFTKAGKPGWAAIVPIYNVIVLLEITGKPLWWIILFLIPFVNIVVEILVVVELAKRFGKQAGYAVLLIFLPFIGFPMLAFGKAQYDAGGVMPAGAQPYAPGPQPDLTQTGVGVAAPAYVPPVAAPAPTSEQPAASVSPVAGQVVQPAPQQPLQQPAPPNDQTPPTPLVQ